MTLIGKAMPYEFDIRVPFFVTGPNARIKKGVKALEPVLNIDIAPTFLELAGVAAPPDMDGRSFVPLLKKYSPDYDADTASPVPWEDVFLIESSGRRDGRQSSFHSSKTVSTLGKKSSKKSAKLDSKNRSQGGSFYINNETAKINKLCIMHPHPCFPGQKKYCRMERNKVQFRKCRKNIDFIEGYPSFTQGEKSGTRMSYNSSDTREKCHCRSRRSAIDWESEREKIDEEIIELKERIYELRQKRRQLRRKQLFNGIYKNFTHYDSQEEDLETTTIDNDEEELELDMSEVKSLEEEEEELQNSKSAIFSSESEQEELDKDSKILEKDDSVVENFFHPAEIIREVSAMSEEELFEFEEQATRQSSKRRNRKKNRNKKKKKNNRRRKFDGLDEKDESFEEDKVDENGEECQCPNETVQWLREREKQDRKRRKLMSKLRKKQKFQTLFENPVERYQVSIVKL